MTEVVVKPDAGTGDTAEHIERMVAKAEGREPNLTENTAQADRPAWLPEGFNTPEELAAAYAAAVAKKPDDAEGEADANTTEADAAAKDALEQAGLSMEALAEKIIATGDIEEADYEALAKVGISKAMATAYIEGQKALGEAVTSRMHSHVGGKETFESIVEWAAGGGLTEAEATAFNKVVDEGSEDALKLALDGLKAKFVASGNNAPRLLGGNRTPATTDVYTSLAQMRADMGDPRYAKDPAFRAAVEQKLFRSNIM